MKKLIEVALPLATARAFLFASLIDDPAEHVEKFPVPEVRAHRNEKICRRKSSCGLRPVRGRRNHSLISSAARAQSLCFRSSIPPTKNIWAHKPERFDEATTRRAFDTETAEELRKLWSARIQSKPVEEEIFMPKVETLRPWRKLVEPHPDVACGGLGLSGSRRGKQRVHRARRIFLADLFDKRFKNPFG